jgi:hypothetical protein
MHVPTKVRRFAVLTLAAMSTFGYFRHRRRKRRDSRPQANSALQPAGWPPEVRKFVRLLLSKGATVRGVRREGPVGRHAWVVEWNGGRTFAFPAESDEDSL